ncbi:tetratricopeptide repeat protein, partial [Archangium sp.]|uniref:tetratricopeptide repeat protein n=1 Tax=Archangium sp. TaxID=1872627 RepID=UPI002D535FF1
VSLNNLGDVLRAQGNQEEALRSFSQSLEIAQRLAAQEPDNAQWQHDVSMSFVRLGDMLRDQGNLEEALRYFSQSLGIRQRLAAREPDNAQWQTDLVVPQTRVASILMHGASTERTEAARLLSQARDTLLRLAASSRLTHEQQHQWLPDIESMLRVLTQEEPEEA